MFKPLSCSGFLPVAILLILFSCHTVRHNTSEVEASMNQYNHLIQKLDADSIALLYTPDGNLGDIAIGRDAIKKLLASFKGVTVLSQTSTTTSIKIVNDTALQTGNYVQTDILSGKDTVIVKGEYTAKWQWMGNDGWHIKRMTTKPVK